MAPPNTNQWTTDPEYIDLLNYFIEKAKDAKCPINIKRIAKEFKEKSGAPQTVECLRIRIGRVRKIIHSFEHIDTKTKVKMLFALSAPVNRKFLKVLKKEALVEVDEKKRITCYQAIDGSLVLTGDHSQSAATVDTDYLEKLRTEALVDVDENNRITYYKANDGTLELKGDHSLSAKHRAAKLESKRSLRSLINNYFKGKNDVDAVPKNEKEKEIGNFIEFITEKCENGNTPLRIRQLANDFNKHFGLSVPLDTTRYRIVGYCREIQALEILDAFFTVKQLFCLKATLDSEYLEKLRKDAVVEVDHLKRITKYTANDGRLTLHRYHSLPAEKKSGRIEWKKKKTSVKKKCNYGGDKDEESDGGDGYSEEEDSDEYSNEESDSEFDSADENNPLDKIEDHLEPSNRADEFDNETPVRNRSLSIDDNFDFDPLSEKSHGNVRINGRYKRSKRRCSDSEDDSTVLPNNSDDKNDLLDETKDRTEPSNEAYDSDNETSVRSLAPTEISIDDNFYFEPPTERSHISEEIGKREDDEKDDSEITENAEVKPQKLRMQPEENPKDDSNDYCPEESDSEFDSDDENDVLDEKEHRVEHSNNADDFDNETPIRSRSLSEISIDDNLGFDPPTEKCHVSGETENRFRTTGHSAKTENAKFKSKRSFRSLIRDYFEKKNNTDAVPDNDDEKEIWNLIEFITKECENSDFPLNILQLARDFNKHFETSRSFACFYGRIIGYCREIQALEILDAFSTVKQLFCLKATLDSEYLEKLRKDAVVEVDNLQRITKYTANNGRLTLHGYHSLPAKKKSGSFFDPLTEKCHVSDEIEIREYEVDDSGIVGNAAVKTRKFKMAPPISNRSTTDSEYINLLNYLIQKAKDAKSPMNIQALAKGFKEKSGAARTMHGIRKRIYNLRTMIHSFDHIDRKSKVKLIFALSASVDPEFLEELKKDAFVEVNYKQRIIYYKANDGSLELRGDHGHSAKTKTAKLKSKGSYRSKLYSYFEKKNDPNAVPDSEEVKETGNLIEFIIEKCENIDRPLSIRQLARDFVDKFQTSTLPDTVSKRIHRYGEEIQRVEFLTIHSRVKQLFGLSATVDSDFLERLRTAALVKHDEKNRITYYKANDGTLELIGDHSAAVKNSNARFETKRRYLMMIGYLSPTYLSMDDYIDFDPPTERSHRSDEIEMMEVYGEKNSDRITGNAAIKTRKFEALPSTSQTPKRKADASAGSSTSKRTKPLQEESINPGEMDDNFSHDDPPRIDLNPFRGPLGLSDGTGEDSDIEEMPMLLPEVIEGPTEEEYEEEAQFSLKSVLNAFKSFILNLDTLGLYQYLVELDMKILESGRRIEVPNKEVMVAMDFLMRELTEDGAPKSSEDSISLREILLMLRTIFLNTSFDGVEVIMEMLKKNIEQLKVQDKKVPVTKVDSVLNATLDIICN